MDKEILVTPDHSGMGLGYQNLGFLDFPFPQGSGSGAGVLWTCGSRAQKRNLSRGYKRYSHEQGRCRLWGRMRSPGQAAKEVMGWGGGLGIDIGIEEGSDVRAGERGEGKSTNKGMGLVRRSEEAEEGAFGNDWSLVTVVTKALMVNWWLWQPGCRG